MKRVLLILAGSLGLLGCSTVVPPDLSLNDKHFAERPFIMKRDDRYYLHYRMALEKEHVNLRMVLWTKKTKDKAYYYFSGPISHPEWGGIVERPLAYDEFTEFARRNAVYFLNPDGSEVKLEIREAETDAPANGSSPRR
jgi:hypothetical protein